MIWLPRPAWPHHLQDVIMTRWPTAHFLTGLALVAGGCGRDANNPTVPDAPAGSVRQAAPRRGPDRPSSPTDSKWGPATLAERLRSVAVKEPVWLVAWYEDGIVSGLLPDQEITLGRRAVKLSQVRRVRGGPATDVELSDGTRISGHFDDLRQIVVTIGNGPHSLDLTRAAEVLFMTPHKDTGTALDATLRGEFPCPLPSSQPVTSAHIFMYSGHVVPRARPQEAQGRLYLEADTKSSLFVALQNPNPLLAFQVRAPVGKNFGVGDYTIPEAAATCWPMRYGQVSVEATGRFVVWEFERSGDEGARIAAKNFRVREGKLEFERGLMTFDSSVDNVGRLAIDFVLHLRYLGLYETWCGQIRHNSSFR
jgi:hypothetical protein